MSMKNMGFVLVFVALLASSGARASEIVAKVDDVPVSSYDLDSYVRMVLVTSGAPAESSSMSKLRPQILDQLIEQKIKQRAFKEANISVDQEDIDFAVANIEKQSGSPAGSLRKALQDAGISMHMLDERLSTDLGWFQLINMKFGRNVTVTDAEIQAELDKMKRQFNRPYVFLHEIFMPVESVLVDNEVYYRALDLIKEIREKGNFQGYAGQFSYSPTKSKGGEIGWVPLDGLPEEFRKAFSRMNKGEISDPVRTVDGYYIFLLKDRKDSLDGDSAPGMTKAAAEQRVRTFKLEQFARKYLRDLRQKTTIEKMM